MQSGLSARAAFGALVVGLGAFVAAPKLEAERTQAATAQAPAAATDDFYGGLTFRNLTVFSRGGRATAVSGVVSDQKQYYMGSTGGGVWRTMDSGSTWTNVSDGYFEAGGIGAISVADSNPNVIYVGTGSACPRGNISAGVGMYKTSDAGKTWQHVGLRDAGQIARIKIHPTNPDIAYVAVLGNIFGPSKERGIYRTRDGGKSWQNVYYVSERTGAADISMDPSNPDILIAGMWTVERKPWTIDSGSTEGGIVRSTDGGTTWTKMRSGLPTGRIGKIGVSISGADPKRVYAQVEADNDAGGFFRSDDGGTTWTRTFTGRALQQRAWYYTHVFADPIDVDTVYALNVGAMKSTDGGKTFGNAGINSHSDHHDLWINPKNNKAMVEANDGGGTVSVDGSAWTAQNNQTTSEIYRLTMDTRVPYWVYGAQQDNDTIAVPSQGTATTYGVGGGESGWIAVDPRDYNITYAGNYGGSIQRSDRKFNRSEDIRVYADMQTGQRAQDMKYRFQWNSPIKLSPHNPDIIYTMSQHVHRSRNAGQDWETISADLTRNDKKKQNHSGGEGITRDNTGVEVYGTIFSFEESPTVAGLLWAGSDDGLMHISRDAGKTWKNITPPGLPEGCINSIDLSPTEPGRAVFAMYRYRQNDFTPYIYETSDYGTTWKRLADGKNGIPPRHFVRVVREDPTRKGLLYAGTEYGLYVSFNDGATWRSMQGNLPITPVTDIKIYRDDLILTTQGRGFWILDNMSIVRGMNQGAAPAAPATSRLFKPEDAYRAGGQVPTFFYWFKDAPTAPVTIDVMDPTGKVVFNITSQPGTASPTTPPPAGGGGRGFGPPPDAAPDAATADAGAGRGRGAAGRGAGAAGAGAAGAAGAPPPAAAGEGGGGQGRGGRGGGQAPGPGGAAGAVQGLNRAYWTNLRYPSPYTVPPGITMWGGGQGPGQGPKVPPGTYTVKVTSGSWSETQTFKMLTNPLYGSMTEAEGAEQVRLASEVGGMIKRLYDDLARIRDVRRQTKEMADKAGASSPIAAASKTLLAALDDAESTMTQMQGEGGQDALNFPGQMDNQLISLYGGIVGPERRLGTPALDRYKDLKPGALKVLDRGTAVLKTDLAAFNKIATSNGQQAIVVK